jgi:hypothetical protein
MKDHLSHAVFSVWVVLILIACVTLANAKHMRLYACVLADNTPGNFLGASSLGSGLWVSDDTGKTWNHLGWKHGKTYSVRVPKYGNGKTIFLARGDGLLRSTDAGSTWRMLTDWRQTEVTDVGALEADPAFLIITTPNGMWRSQDSGKTWMKLTKGVESLFVSRIEFHPKFPNRMAAATEKGLFTSNDRGESWRLSGVDSASMHYLFYSSDVRLHWVGERGEVQGEKMYPLYNEDLIGKMWCIEELVGRYAVSGPKGTFIVSNRDEEPIEMDTTIKNPHTLCAVGNTLFVGSLGGGIAVFDLSADIPKRLSTSLPNAEVWTIRKQEVE